MGSKFSDGLAPEALTLYTFRGHLTNLKSTMQQQWQESDPIDLKKENLRNNFRSIGRRENSENPRRCLSMLSYYLAICLRI